MKADYRNSVIKRYTLHVLLMNRNKLFYRFAIREVVSKFSNVIWGEKTYISLIVYRISQKEDYGLLDFLQLACRAECGME